MYDETTEVYPHDFVDMYWDLYDADDDDDYTDGLLVILQAKIDRYNKSIGRDWDSEKAILELIKQFWRFEMGNVYE